jgi:hypothetical protein
MAEAPNGWIKSVLGFRQFGLRGHCGSLWRINRQIKGASDTSRIKSSGNTLCCADS